MKMSNSGHNERNAPFLGGLNYLGITNRAAWFDYRNRTSVRGLDHAIGERIKRIAGYEGAFERQSMPVSMFYRDACRFDARGLSCP